MYTTLLLRTKRKSFVDQKGYSFPKRSTVFTLKNIWAGTKVKKTVSEIGVDITTTLYLGNMIFVDDSLQFAGMEEGRIRKVDTSFVYDFFVKDHLGNVRMVLTDELKTDMYPAATMETATISTEETLYGNLTNTQYARPSWFSDINSGGTE